MTRSSEPVTSERAHRLALAGLTVVVVVLDGLLALARWPILAAGDRPVSPGPLVRGAVALTNLLPVGVDTLQWLLTGLALGASLVGLLWATKVSRRAAVVVGLVSLLALCIYTMTGLILPWDQGSFWLAQSLLEVTTAVPVLGRYLAGLLFGGITVSRAVLGRAYLYHYGLLAVGVLAVLRALGPREWVTRFR